LSLPFINVRFMRVGKTASLLPVPDIFNESIEVQALRMTFCGADFGQMKLISTTFFGISFLYCPHLLFHESLLSRREMK
jgi:hypothetical protein